MITLRARGAQDYGGSVADDFGDPGDQLGSVVSDGDDAVSSELKGVLDHELVRLLPGLLRQFRVEGDVSSEDLLEAGAHLAKSASATAGDSTNHAQTSSHFESVEAIGSCNPLMDVAHGAIVPRSAAYRLLVPAPVEWAYG